MIGIIMHPAVLRFDNVNHLLGIEPILYLGDI